MNDRENQDLDERIAEAFREDPADPRRVEQRVLRQISAKRQKRRAAVAALAAAVLIAVFIGVNRPPKLLVDAARDHRVEVMEHKPRRWTTDPAEFEPKFGLTVAKASSLAPEGFWLLHARTCGLEGQKALHLVFTNGTREISVYVRKTTQGQKGSAHIGAEELAAARSAEYQTVAVTTGSAAECQQIARRAAERL